MERGSWAELSQDPDIWKKMGLGGLFFLFVVPIPLALGAVQMDLEAEVERRKSDDEAPTRDFPAFDNPTAQFGRGIAALVFFLVPGFASLLPCGLLMISLGVLYASFVGEYSVGIIPKMSYIVGAVLAIALQFLCAVVVPVALAQYARGLSVRSALDPMSNFGHLMSFEPTFFLKASGWWIFLLGVLFVSLQSPSFLVSTAVLLLLAVLGYTSLVLSSRHALAALESGA